MKRNYEILPLNCLDRIFDSKNCRANSFAEREKTQAASQSRANIFSVALTCRSLQSALDHIIDYAVAGRRGEFAFVDSESLNQAWSQPLYRAALNQMTEVYAHGINIALAAKFQGDDLLGGVNPKALIPRLCELAAEKSLKLFLLGGQPGVARTCTQLLRDTYPGIQVVGFHSGFFEPSRNSHIIEKINASDADIVFVSFGSQFEEYWIQLHREELQIPVCIAIDNRLEQFFSDRLLCSSARSKISRLLHIEIPVSLLTQLKFLYRAYQWTMRDR